MQIKNNFITQIFYKIFNRDEYLKNRILAQNEKNKITFKKKK